MKYTELITSLGSTGYPVAEGAFPTDDRPEMPYITYQRNGDRALFADGSLYWYAGAVEIHLYTTSKDAIAEAKVRQALTDTGYTWEEARNARQNCYDITIKLEV